MVLRLSDFRGDTRLPPLSFAASCPHPAGRRSRPRAVGAVPDYEAQLSAQIRARYHRADRLPAAQGAAPQRARSGRLAAVASRGAFLGKARAAMRGQCDPVRRPCCRRRVVGLSVAVDPAAIDMDDGHYAHPQHRRTCRRAGLEPSLAQYAHHARQCPGAAVHRALLRQLSSRTSSPVLHSLLQPASGASHSQREPVFRRHGGATRLCCGAAACGDQRASGF
jgi:hypothetical protein